MNGMGETIEFLENVMDVVEGMVCAMGFGVAGDDLVIAGENGRSMDWELR